MILGARFSVRPSTPPPMTGEVIFGRSRDTTHVCIADVRRSYRQLSEKRAWHQIKYAPLPTRDRRCPKTTPRNGSENNPISHGRQKFFPRRYHDGFSSVFNAHPFETTVKSRLSSAGIRYLGSFRRLAIGTYISR